MLVGLSSYDTSLAYSVFLISTSHVIRSRFQSLLCQASLSFLVHTSDTVSNGSFMEVLGVVSLAS